MQWGLPSCKDYDVHLKRRPIFELETVVGEARDGASVLDLDVPIDDVFTRADICSKVVRLTRGAKRRSQVCRHERLTKVIASRTCKRKLEDARPVYS